MSNSRRTSTGIVRTRNAISYATDKATIYKVVWAGTRALSYSGFSTSSPYFNKAAAAAAPHLDLDKAKALLKAYGKPVNITVECIPTPEADQLQAIIQQDWEAVRAEV